MEQSSFGRLVGVLVSPTKTFQGISEKPNWAAPLVVLLAMGLLNGFLMMGRIDWAEVTRDSLESQGQELSEDQVESAIDLTEKVGPVMMIGGGLFGQPVIYLLTALVLMVVFKMLGGELSFLSSFSVLLHSMMPRALMGLLSIPVILGRDEFGFEELQDGSVLTSNLGSFAPEGAGDGLVTLLSSIDIFSVWVVALLILGYAVVANVSKQKVAGGVIALWVVYVLGKVGLAALRGS